MPRKLLDRYEIELVINGEAARWESLTLEEFSLHESVKQRFPTAELHFSSDAYYILNNPVLDGSSVIITLQDTQTDPPAPQQTYRMRAFNTVWKPVAQSFKHYISLYLDAEDLHQARSKSYGKTTSSNAIAQAAQDAGLSPECDPSADVQVWLRPNIKGADFIYRTAQRSYAGPLSCFVTGIGATHILRHYNIHDRRGGSGGWIFKNVAQQGYPLQENEILYEDAKFKTVSGTNNSYAGYGTTVGTFDLSKGFTTPVTKLAGLFSGAFQVSQKMMGSQKAQTTQYDSDNTHDNFMQAGTQNTAIKSLFSVLVEITTHYGKAPLLLDLAILEPRAMGLEGITNNQMVTPWAGSYFISEIHTLVTPAVVVKKYMLLKEGLNFGDRIMGMLGEAKPESEQPADKITT
jgi:hypothetical protein